MHLPGGGGPHMDAVGSVTGGPCHKLSYPMRIPSESMLSLLKASPSNSVKVMKTHSFLEMRVKASDLRE